MLFLAAGCGGPNLRLEDDPEVRTLVASLETARPFRLGVAPIEGADAPTRTAEEALRDPGRAPMRVDGRALRDELCDALRRFTPFRDVHPLDSAPPGRAAFAQALAAGDDAVLVVRIGKLDDVFRGRNGWFVPNLLLWYYLWVPSWFIPDETYGADLDAEAVFYDVRSEKPIAAERIRAETRRMLDDFERGWDIFGLFRVPGSLDDDGWRKVGEQVDPEALFELRRQVTLAAGRKAQPALEHARPPSTFAVLCGVPRYRASAIPGSPASAQDLAAIGGSLSRAGVPHKNVRALPGESATRAGLEDALREAATSAGDGDSLLLYFSGACAVDEHGEVALLGCDADPQAAMQSGLTLGRVREILERGRARRALIILDAALGGGGRRGFGPGSASGDSVTASFGRAVDGGARASAGGPLALSILSAAGPGETAGDLEGAGTGLFTYYLADGAAGNADADGDGTITLEELAAHVVRHVPAQAEVEGRRQHPRLYAPAGAPGPVRSWLGQPRPAPAPPEQGGRRP